MSKDHTCILFEDGKCVYCGKEWQSPVVDWESKPKSGEEYTMGVELEGKIAKAVTQAWLRDKSVPCE